MSPELVDAALLRRNVEETAHRLAQAPDEGRVRPWVSTRLEQDVRAVARFVQYDQPYEFWCDESVTRGGKESAPSPMRYLLSGIAFCLQVWCAKTSSVHGIQLDELRVDVRSLLDQRGEHLVGHAPSHPQWFVLDVRVQSSAESALVARAIQDAARRCPVTSLVRRAVPVYLLISHQGSVVYDERPEGIRREHEEVTTR